MMDYRLFHLRDGHFVKRDEIIAASDAEAAAEAERRRAGAPAELWCGPRKVRHYGGSQADR
jgi:hypothetical protein